MAQVIDGKALAERLRASIGAEVSALQARHGKVPGLATVLVGDDAASAIYVRNKIRQTREVGMVSHHHALDAGTSQEQLTRLISDLNADPRIHGILVQLPLPQDLDAEQALHLIDPAKDVDGFHVVNVGKLGGGQHGVVPCTPLGCLMMLQQLHGSLKGMHALVIGRSHIVGRPMAQLLLKADCTVTIAHSHTRGLPDLCRQADIVVAAVGRPEFVQAGWIRPGATVIDVGINRIEKGGKSVIVGDVAFSSSAAVAGAITPVPGGVGPMTIACLLLNTLTAFCMINGLPEPAIGSGWERA